jgi:hypothetical protein
MVVGWEPVENLAFLSLEEGVVPIIIPKHEVVVVVVVMTRMNSWSDIDDNDPGMLLRRPLL